MLKTPGSLPRLATPAAPAPRRLLATGLALGAGLTTATAIAPAADAAGPLSCPHQKGTNHYLCSWYTAGNGTTAGTPVQAATGARVGYLHQGQNWIVCQQRGSRVTKGRSTNVWWGFTTADNGKTGWSNAVYAKGGKNDGTFGSGVPNCNGSHGPAPITKPTPPKPTPPKPPAKPRYVALGDSFQSGEGAGSYYPAASGRPSGCDRSKNAYAPRLAGSTKGRYSFSQATDFLACSGDEVPDLLERQIPRMGANIGVVTVGIGGNDVGFAPIIKSCIINQHPGGTTCDRIIKDAFKTKIPRLKSRLNTAYSAIRAHAPGATVVVLGYPAIFEDSYRSFVCTSTALTRGARSDLREAANTLDDTIEPIAQAHGFRYADPRKAFEDHRICGSDSDWFHGIITNGHTAGTFHPNSDGQKGFANVLRDQEGDLFD